MTDIHFEPVTLETDRLVLRMHRNDDIDGYASMHADAETVQYLGRGQTMSRSEAWRHMALVNGHWHLLGYGMWAVEEKSSGLWIGRVGAWNPLDWPEFEIGWAILPEYQGKGYATEAGAAARDWCFETLGRDRICSVIRPGNDPSVKVAEKLGETFERTEDDVLGSPAMIYSISREHWLEIKSAN